MIKYLLLLLIPLVSIGLLDQQVFGAGVFTPNGDGIQVFRNFIGCTFGYECVDESTADDSDYIQSDPIGNFGSNVHYFELTDHGPQDPTEPHVMRWRAWNPDAGLSQHNIALGVADRDGNPIVFAPSIQPPLPTTPTDYEYTMTFDQASLITDYDGLQFVIATSCGIGCDGNEESLAVSWVQFEVGSGSITIEPPVLMDVADYDPFSLEITWNEPSDTTNIFQYNLYREDKPGGGFTQVNSYPVGTTLVVDTGLTPETTYSYYLTSEGSSGESVPSNIIVGQTTSASVEAPILNSVSELSSNEVQLDWTEPSDITFITQYDIHRSDNGGTFNFIDSVSVGSTTYLDSGVSAGNTYTYRLVSVGTSGNSAPSNEISITISSSSLEAPTMAEPTFITSDTVEVKWFEPLDLTNIMQYNIYKDENGGGFSLLDTVPIGQNILFDFGPFAPSTVITYRATSVDFTFTESANSNEVSITSGSGTISPPTGLNAAPFDLTTIMLDWQEPSDTTEIMFYSIERDEGFGFIEIAQEPVGSVTFFDFGVLPFPQQYTYRIVSIGPIGQSQPSTPVISFGAETNFPDAPEIKDGFSDGISTVTINWEEPPDTTGYTSYHIMRRIAGESGFSTIDTVAIGTTSYTDLLVPADTFEYRISSESSFGIGIPSATITIVTNIDPFFLESTGQTVEPNATNNFSKLEIEMIAQTVELFELDPASVDLIIADLDTNQLNAYEVIEKMNDGSYDSSQEMLNAGLFYGGFYIDLNDLDEFTTEIEELAKDATGGSGGSGDDSQHGVEQTGE